MKLRIVFVLASVAALAQAPMTFESASRFVTLEQALHLRWGTGNVKAAVLVLMGKSFECGRREEQIAAIRATEPLAQAGVGAECLAVESALGGKP
jgi:hypothetical protein